MAHANGNVNVGKKRSAHFGQAQSAHRKRARRKAKSDALKAEAIKYGVSVTAVLAHRREGIIEQDATPAMEPQPSNDSFFSWRDTHFSLW